MSYSYGKSIFIMPGRGYTSVMVKAVKLMNTKEAAAALGLSRGRVKQLCQSGQLKAEKIGRDWVIRESEVIRFRNTPRRPGRPWPSRGEE